MTEILSPGYTAFKDAHSGATTAKTPLLINSILVIPLNDADADEDNVFVYECPRVKVDKAGSQAWTPLTKIYWDDTAKNFTTTSTDNTLAGVVAEDAASADTEGEIHLTPFVNA
ncbi:MAG: DUF2190 family protein [Pseudomonadota bacterium]|nr:DUF2190 family protein [Pseudomonadota bacterium]